MAMQQDRASQLLRLALHLRSRDAHQRWARLWPALAPGTIPASAPGQLRSLRAACTPRALRLELCLRVIVENCGGHALLRRVPWIASARAGLPGELAVVSKKVVQPEPWCLVGKG